MEMPRYKGRFITQKRLDKLQKLIEFNKSKKKTPDNSKTDKINQSVRLVNISFLANHLECKFCQENLLLKNIEKEHRRGWGIIFTIKCTNCLTINKVPSGPKHKGSNGTEVFDVNTKVVLGALHAGVGIKEVNTIFQTVGLDAVSPQTFKSYENEFRPTIQEFPEKSCEEACPIEQELIFSANDIEEFEEKPDVSLLQNLMAQSND